VSEVYPVVGSDVTVKLEVFNAGTAPALGVELSDVSFAAMSAAAVASGTPLLGASPSGGPNTARFSTVPAGGNVTHTYAVTAKAR
jgi:hypothetical protein